ncbi:F-box protein [Artemisia annua]|uniref:F-box protein n=1 Tax=Artemisia annua TaxID=35608 RepID=A0A2U1Q7Y6_ARTAN|nr:F-box protein [Artemisia annua]
MTSFFRQDNTTTNHPQPPLAATVDHFDLLPDSLLLVIFNNVKDVKSLGKCCVVSKRFYSLIPQVQNIMIHVDCVISDNNTTKPYKPFSVTNILRQMFGSVSNFLPFSVTNILRQMFGSVSNFLPFSVTNILRQMFGSVSNFLPFSVTNILRQMFGSVSNFLRPMHANVDHKQQKHHSPTHVLRNFKDVRELTIELPKGELDMEDEVLLKWRADFGSTLHSCMMLAASSVIKNLKEDEVNDNDNNGSISDSFYTNGRLKMRVVWTISTLIAASARHYLLREIIDEHKTLKKLVLSDVDRQGVLRMNKEEMDELRVKPLSVSLSSNRTMVPALSIKLWYAPYLKLSDGSVLKGATLLSIRPSDKLGSKEVNDGSWVEFEEFEEPYRTAARMLVKGKTYCLEMNSF